MAVCFACEGLQCGLFAARASMVLAVSSDGGATWTSQGVVRDGCRDNRINDKNFMEVDTSPIDLTTGEDNPHYGNQYVCWDRGNNEKVAYSTDGGAGWTEVDLPTVEGREIGCEMAVGDDGIVHLVWGGIDPGFQWNRSYYSASSDGGRTFEPNVRVTRPSEDFPNSDIAYSDFNTTDNSRVDGNQTGEYLGLDARAGKAYLSWTDSREYFPVSYPENQLGNIAFGIVEFSSTSGPEIFADGFEKKAPRSHPGTICLTSS